MKVGIMQPYLFPYMGYFQLINAVDTFVVYDAIKYTKKGWINRNRILQNGKPVYFTLPLKKDSDYLYINQRYVAEKELKNKKQIIMKIAGAYKKAPHFDAIFPLMESVFLYEANNLFEFLYNSLCRIISFLEIKTEIVISSTLKIEEDLKSQDKVLAICNILNANQYLNPIGGIELYDQKEFLSNGIDLFFIKSKDIKYPQFDNNFVPALSIIDVLMFNSKSTIQMYLEAYSLQK